MDLGFGGFLERFEHHFGRWPTKGLLVLIGLAVASLCGSVIWTYLLLPFAQLLPDPRSGPAFEFGKLVVIVALFLMIVNQLLQAFDNWVRRKLRRQAREQLEEARRILDLAEEHGRGAREHHEEARADLEEAKNLMAAAELTMDRIFAYVLEHGMLTQAEVNELRSMM